MFLEEASCPKENFDNICTLFPELRVVLVGTTYGIDRWLYPLLRKHPNIYVCLGHVYIPAWGPMRFVESFGAKRLLFGSGLPTYTPGGLITHVTYADLPDADKEDIFHGNLERLLSEVQL